MKCNLFIVLIFLFSIKLFSQDSKFSIELNYPIPVDKNFIGENYKGVIDLGISYKVFKFNSVNLGVSTNVGILKYDSNRGYKITSRYFQPRIFTSLMLKNLEKLQPSIALGYTIMKFDAAGNNDGFIDSYENDSLNGFNVNLGLAYDVLNRVFVKIQYDFVKLKSENVPDVKFNTHVNLFKVGLGYRF